MRLDKLLSDYVGQAVVEGDLVALRVVFGAEGTKNNLSAIKISREHYPKLTHLVGGRVSTDLRVNSGTHIESR